MRDLTRSQLGLLLCCSINEAPNIKELYEFGPRCGASRESLRADYIILLNELMVMPIGDIDVTTYLPLSGLITEKGKEYLQRVFDYEPNRVPPIEFPSFDIIREDLQWKDVIRGFPTFDESPADEIAILADSYLHWAQYFTANSIRTPQYKLFYAAARGFAKFKDLRRFSKSVNGCFTALQEEGNYLTIAIFATHVIEDFPDCADITLSTAFLVLEKPYFDLTGKKIPELTKLESLQDLLKEIAGIAIQTGKGYKLKIPDPHSLIGIASRIEDILREAFRTSNRSLYLQVIGLESYFVQLAKNMVEITEETESFESRAGYGILVAFAEHSCLVLQSYADLVNLEEPLRKSAYDNTLKILRIIQRGAVVPVWDMCEMWDSDENRAGYWTFYLLGFTEKKMRANLFRLFTQLDELRAKLDIEKTEPGLSAKSLVDPAAIKGDRDYIKRMIPKLDKVESDTKVIRFVLIPAVEARLIEVLEISQANQNILEDLCLIILRSDTLLHDIDSVLNEMLPEMRLDVECWAKAVEKSTKLSINEREIFLKELGEIVKMSSAGKILASVPLIPGFLQYRYELGVSVNWNKWLGKLRSLFKKG